MGPRFLHSSKSTSVGEGDSPRLSLLNLKSKFLVREGSSSMYDDDNEDGTMTQTSYRYFTTRFQWLARLKKIKSGHLDSCCMYNAHLVSNREKEPFDHFAGDLPCS